MKTLKHPKTPKVVQTTRQKPGQKLGGTHISRGGSTTMARAAKPKVPKPVQNKLTRKK